MKTLELIQPLKFDAVIDTSDKVIDGVTKILSALLCSEMNLYVKTRKYHWNAADENFKKLHVLFDIQYKQLEQAIDNIADRISSFGGKNIGIMQEFAKRTSIKETPGKYMTSRELLEELSKNHERIAIQLLRYIDECMDSHKDIDTADFLTGLLQEHENTKWAIRKYIN